MTFFRHDKIGQISFMTLSPFGIILLLEFEEPF
jgi:hypothetical protein